ncbi:hypothetical protein FHW84_002495 [Dyella sp. SG562]|uniref:hypothetical protein n=1 Tax=Dyella sp. SG562 TaxID=2587017 RepID=UPI001423FA7F|nr:hypothetical protein [Dyella sp. SG562]NII73922.1 hypothetical protein [Dyella sp. SG562]
MLASLEAKLIAIGLVLAALAGGFIWYGHTRYEAGAASVQAKWDIDKSAQDEAVGKASAASVARFNSLTSQFNQLSAKYEEMTHDPMPAVADSVSAGVRNGTLGLRGEVECPVHSGTVDAATARSRAADAAATQALADRVQAAIAAVRAGDEADQRERQLGQQVVALQGILRAERETSSP